METPQRYEIVDTIASGDFATVYRARDRDLAREVAIKQIHQQFLDDPRQLERYWGEAQLLASLQHPNILTIYDLVRPRGWLVLELMHGSMEQQAKQGPIDLDRLRYTLICGLNALQFLHSNGVIHGDVKPSNMLIDTQGRMKLGDFGLARRASGEGGSLLKGTTKYMAPELVTDKFGQVGPASDLYSLGFSAYELMCGPQFEALFPGLSTFGRDKQIAWMMWHATPDRQLPQIDQVLQGVPTDLAHVIQRMVAKDQSKRYQSAAEALRDLQADQSLVAPPKAVDAEAQAAALAAEKQKRRKRFAAIVVFGVSIMVSLAILIPPKQEVKPPGPPEPIRGIVRKVYPNERKFIFESAEDGSPKEIAVKPKDRIFINGKAYLLRDLRPGDRTTIKIHREESGRRVVEITATRPEVRTGTIGPIEADEGHFTLNTVDNDNRPKQIVIHVPAATPILLNGEKLFDGQPVTLSTLKVGDRIVVHDIGKDDEREATELSADRVVAFKGIVRDLDTAKKKLTIAISQNGKDKLTTLPYAPNCEVTINDRRFIHQKVLTPTDLRPGDKVDVAHDTRIVRVNAYRVLGHTGTINRIQYSAKTLEVVIDGQDKSTLCVVGPKCTVSLAGEVVALDSLRPGDKVEITHDTPDATTPNALTVAASRSLDRNRWAIVIGCQKYDDTSLSPIEHADDDATLFRETLVKRHRVPSNQALLLIDESLIRLEQGISNALSRITPQDDATLFFSGRAYKTPKGTVYLASKNFDLKRIKVTGLSLQWLVDNFEKCRAKRKLMLLDCVHEGNGPDMAKQPAPSEVLSSLKSSGGRSPLQTVTLIVAASGTEKSGDLADKQHGRFAFALAEGYSGVADKNRDDLLEVTELFSFLKHKMAIDGNPQSPQTPQLVLPDDRPPRLTEEAKRAIRTLAIALRQKQINTSAASIEYAAAKKLSGKETEPQLLYGLVLLKGKERDAAAKQFKEIKVKRTGVLLPLQALAWIRFEKRTYESGVDELTELVNGLPKPRSGAYTKDTLQLFQWIGKMGEFAATAAQTNRRAPSEALEKLDAAIAKHNDQAKQSYNAGRAATRNIEQTFDQKLTTAIGAAKSKLKIERHQLKHYVTFPFNQMAQEILEGLEK